MIYIGTSGFSYPEWKGIFYPERLPANEYLSFYAQRFITTEINSTFYRSPSESMVKGWFDKVPENFRFALKINQKITHKKRLKAAEEDMEWFLKGAGALRHKLGVLLIQLPPYFRQDLPLLGDFLQQHCRKAPLAVEFRHESWSCDETFQLLSDCGVSWAVAESDERPAVRKVTAPFVYVRLRKSDYSDEELKEWVEWLQSLKEDVFVYLKHDEKAPLLASRLREFSGSNQATNSESTSS